MKAVSVEELSFEIESKRIKQEGKIGIICGSGPEAGIDLWTKILHLRRAAMGDLYRGDIDAPSLKIVSIPLLGLSMSMDVHGNTVRKLLIEAAVELANDCTVFAVACNTLHSFQDELSEIGESKFVSIVDTVKLELEAKQVHEFALLGASPVMELSHWSPFASLRDKYEIETADPAELDNLIYEIKTKGSASADLTGRLMNTIEQLESELVVLACTELPMVKPIVSTHTLVDVTSLLANQLLERIGN